MSSTVSWRGLALAPLAFAAGLAAQQSGVVNAPVAPEAIYIGTAGPFPGISVIDLNGFGQGTGDPGNTRFPLNPNIGAPGVTPPLAPGTTTLDAGSAGVLTLTRDHLGSPRLGGPTLGSIADLQLGQPLDLVWNNSNINVNAASSNQVNPATMQVQAGNTIMVAPHPNPPRLVFPPPNLAQGIEAEEPTVTSSTGPPGTVTTTSPPCLASPVNLLVPGNPFQSPPNLGILGANFPGVFYGPQPPPPLPPPPTPFCPFTSRQQIGHFLYAIDRDNREVVVFNSNRFTVLARIALQDPHRMAMSPNLRWLAVSNFAADSVSFIDTDPRSRSFHQVVAVTRVGRGPRALAWQPDHDDLLVCNTTDSTVSIIEPASFTVRRTIRDRVQSPVGIAVTSRQVNFGFSTHTYFAYVLNANGSVAIYESGPSSLGPDDTVALVAPFRTPRAIQPDASTLSSAVWITHADEAGLAQVSRLALTHAPFGLGRRDQKKLWTVTARIGGLDPTTPIRTTLSGNAAVDIAFDDIHNAGAHPEFPSAFHQVPQAAHSSQGHVRSVGGVPAPVASPILMFVALADAGVVDVIEPATGRLVTSIPAPGVSTLCHYWRQ